MTLRFAPLPLLALSLLIGCATPKPHVELPRAPTADAPWDERAAYFKDYALGSREPDHLYLHGGTRVYWPEDLLPAVDEDSPTAKAITEHVQARERVEAWSWMGLGALGAYGLGGAVMLGSPFLYLAASDLPNDDRTTILFGGLATGGAIFLGGAGLHFLHTFIVWEDAEKAAEAADRSARTYPQSLSDRLGVGMNADGLLFDRRMPASEPEPKPPEGAQEI